MDTGTLMSFYFSTIDVSLKPSCYRLNVSVIIVHVKPVQCPALIAKLHAVIGEKRYLTMAVIIRLSGARAGSSPD
jgi:hypothetical protein